MTTDPVLTPAQRDLLAPARRALLATIAPDGRPRLVPICFVLDDGRPILYSPLDEKSKQADEPLELARVRDLLRDPRVSVLVDRWDEDWTRLAWLRCHGFASLLESGGTAAAAADAAEHRAVADADAAYAAEHRAVADAADAANAAEHRAAVAALRAKYPQYATHDLAGRPIIRIAIERTTSWAAEPGWAELAGRTATSSAGGLGGAD